MAKVMNKSLTAKHLPSKNHPALIIFAAVYEVCCYCLCNVLIFSAL